MGVRKWVNDNSTVTTYAAVGMLAVGLAFVLWRLGGTVPAGDADAFFYDVDNDEIFVASGTLLPPIETPAGSQRGIRAHIYACGGCPSDLTGRSLSGIEEQGAFVAWFERYPSEVKTVLESSRARGTGASSEEEERSALHEAELHGPVVRRIDDTRWIRLESQAGMDVINTPVQRCGGEEIPILCTP